MKSIGTAVEGLHPGNKSPKSKEEIFRELIQDARKFWPELPDTPERMDPVLRMLFGAFSSQFESLYNSLEETSDKTFESMARHMYYDALRSPTPAVTLLQFEPTDEGIEIDELTTMLYSEERGRERSTYYFSPVARLHLVQASPTFLFLQMEEGLLDLTTRILNKEDEIESPQIYPIQGGSPELINEGRMVFYFGIKNGNGSNEMPDINLYVDAPEKILSLLRWGTWIPSDTEGDFNIERKVFPEKGSFDFSWQDKISPLLPHHRSPNDFLVEFENHYYSLTNLVLSPPPGELNKLLGENYQNLLGSCEDMAWIKVILPSEVMERNLLEIRGIYLNCVPTINLSYQTHSHVTQGLPLVEITLQDPLDSVYRIEEIRDSVGNYYENRLLTSNLLSPYLFSIREEGEYPKIVIHYEKEQKVPERIQITYSITQGDDANGIEPGLINELYDKRRHPGIESVKNITRTLGGRRAPSREDILRGFTHLLRNHSRAITSKDLVDLTSSFDPRILKATCQSGIERGPHGARRCINIHITLRESSFSTSGEKEYFRKRLKTYLTIRSPVNSAVNLIMD
jgi:hypothetical protein